MGGDRHKMNSQEPLVSVLIPTYNRPFYFEQALKSALTQTYKNIEIVIGDDSTNDETEQLIQPYLKQYPTIRYIKNKKNIGQFENDLMLLEESNGEFVNLLKDDDLFHPQKLELMVPPLRDQQALVMVSSHRQEIDAMSNLLPIGGVTVKITNQPSLLGRQSVAQLVYANPNGFTIFNFIGEPTTVLFRKSSLKVPFGSFAGRKYGCNVDLATWFSLLLEGQGLYLPDTLSYIRVHPGKQANSAGLHLKSMADHAHSLYVAPNYGFMDKTSKVYEIALQRLFKHITHVISQYQPELYFASNDKRDLGIQENNSELKIYYKYLSADWESFMEIELNNLLN